MKEKGGIFVGRDGLVVAEVDPPWFPNQAIRATRCSGILQTPQMANQRGVCPACALLDNTLRKALSRQGEKSDVISKYTPVSSLTRDQLLDVARSNSAQLRQQKANYQRLLEKQKAMKDLNQDDSGALTGIFNKLKSGIKFLDDRLNSPECHWESCSEKFETVAELHKHCCASHSVNTGGQLPCTRQYKCMWSGCTRKAFQKHEHLVTHLYEHTGKQSDEMMAILLADQAKALQGPKTQMRWHPAVIRWCLQQHSRSSSAYEEMRQAGFLRLPTSRTLQDYATFTEPESG